MTSRADTLAVGAIAIGIASLVLLSSSSRFIWTDDGIYLSTAQALAKRHEYRLINLPTSPPQTKYPPLYPALLALAWPAAAEYPNALRHLKTVNVIALALVTLLTAGLGSRALPGRRLAPPVAALFAAVSPALVSHAEQFTSDLWFTVFLLVACSLPRGERWTTREALVAAGVAGLAVLTRTIGIAVAVGVFVELVRRGSRRQLAISATIFGLMTVPWAIWCVVNLADVSPLLRGYITYERSLWLRVPDMPVLAGRLILKNMTGLAVASEIVLGTVTWWLTAAVVFIAAMGAWRCRRQFWWRTTVAIAVPYGIIVIGHPYPMIRYLVPMVPLLLVIFVSGIWAAFEQASRRKDVSIASVATVAFVVALWFGVNAEWLARFPFVTRDTLHGGFGRPMQFPWAGFEETFRYVETHTSPSAVMATPYDSLYFMFTGRQAVRPWFHSSDLYEPAYGLGPYECEDVTALRKELRRFHVSYLIVDPMLKDLDSGYGASCINGLLERYDTEWTLTYVSADRLHRVYRSLVEAPPAGP